METCLKSIQVIIDLDNNLALSKKMISNLLLGLKEDYEKRYKVQNDFVYLVDRNKGSQLVVEPSRINIIERKNYNEIDIKNSLNKIVDILTYREAINDLPVKVNVEFHCDLGEANPEGHLTNFNSIINAKNLKQPFFLTGINFMTEDDDTIYSISISIRPEGYVVEVKSDLINYDRLEFEIEHIKNSLTNEICNLLNEVSIG